MTNISHVAGFAIASTHNTGLTIIIIHIIKHLHKHIMSKFHKGDTVLIRK